MLASEACPICRNRIEGKPTDALALRRASRARREGAAAPRWSFECFRCQYQWVAEPVSQSLMAARI